MEWIRRLIDRLILLVLVLEGVLLVLIITISVFFRYVLDAALSWPDEVAGIIFVWYTLLGVVVLVGTESHIAFDVVEKYAPAFVGKAIRVLSQSIVILYGVVMTIYGWKYLRLFPDETSPAAGINLNWLKSAIPVTGVLVITYVALNMIDALRAPSHGDGKGAK